MLNTIKSLWNFSKRKHNCSPVCGTCEVEISERTAQAIIRTMDRRISKFLKTDPKAASVLQAEKDLIQKDHWQVDYDLLSNKIV